MNTDVQKLDTWGILELFGHLKLAGKITEQPIGGDSLIRIDVPEITAGSVVIPSFSRFFGAKAVYSLTPCTEDLAKATAAAVKHQPIAFYDLPEQWRQAIQQPKLPSPDPRQDLPALTPADCWGDEDGEDPDEDL